MSEIKCKTCNYKYIPDDYNLSVCPNCGRANGTHIKEGDNFLVGEDKRKPWDNLGKDSIKEGG
jgi:Zn finger protein HypA/HybF involved in hydrogenase expression